MERERREVLAAILLVEQAPQRAVIMANLVHPLRVARELRATAEAFGVRVLTVPRRDGCGWDLEVRAA